MPIRHDLDLQAIKISLLELRLDFPDLESRQQRVVKVPRLLSV